MRGKQPSEDWRVKFRKFMREVADQMGVERPRIIELPKRDSGPIVFPRRWHEPEVNATLPHRDDPTPPKAA